jgi:hypothetical protein
MPHKQLALMPETEKFVRLSGMRLILLALILISCLGDQQRELVLLKKSVLVLD